MKKVFLTDDDEDDRMLVRFAIERVVKDVEIVELSCGEDLLHAIEGLKDCSEPLLILMDMNMPRMNGLETLALLRSNDSFRHIPIVMMSTTSHNNIVKEAYQHGVNAFMEKPIVEQDFIRLAHAVDVCLLSESRTFDHFAGDTSESVAA